jgi:hypothetical protein
MTGAVLGALFVVRYKIPALCRKVAELEKENKQHKDFIRKSEIYEADGQPRYQHRELCLTLRGECMQENQGLFNEIKGLLVKLDTRIDAMDEKSQTARTEQFGFMVAVKEKLNLNFELPKIK